MTEVPINPSQAALPPNSPTHRRPRTASISGIVLKEESQRIEKDADHATANYKSKKEQKVHKKMSTGFDILQVL